MRSRSGFLYVAFASCIFTTAAHALTIQEAFEKAKEQNPERASLVAQREALLARSNQAMAPSQPTFALGIGDLASRPGPDNSDLRTYQLSQSLGFPGKARISARSYDLDASSVGQEIVVKDLEIARLVKTAFFELWLSTQKNILNERKHSAFEKILSVAKRRFAKDTTTEVEYLSLEVDLKKIENDRADIVASERGFRVSLNTLLGLPPEAATKVDAPSFSPSVSLNEAALRERFAKSNPTIQTLKIKTELANNRVREAKWTYLPDFKLSGGTNSFGAYAGIVEMSFPLWFWWNENSGVKAARASFAASEADFTSRERELLSSFEGKLIALSALQEKLKNYKGVLVPNSRKAFEIALKNYRFGKIEFTTLTSSAENLVNSELEYDSLLIDFELKRAETEEMLGGTI